MVRGAGKAQAQAKAQAKAAGQSQAKSQYGDRLKAMKMMCPVSGRSRTRGDCALIRRTFHSTTTQVCKTGVQVRESKESVGVCAHSPWISLQNYTTFTAHWESRHPKDPIPSQDSLSGYVK